MGWIGIGVLIASLAFIVSRKPITETLIALWQGQPRIEQPPSTRRPPIDAPPPPDQGRSSAVSVANNGATRRDDRPRDMPLSPIPTINPPADTEAESPQTTPKATPAAGPTTSVSSFSLSPEPPASAAAVARDTATSMRPPSLPALNSPAGRMAPPPPRPPKLNALSSTSSLSPPSRGPVPNRGASYDRQPGSSTLAPPPTHSSKPSKPSRKVTLEPGHSPLDWARLANHPASDLRNLGPNASYLRVTPSMLKAQTGRKGKDAWTALGGRVYNITPYLPFHPGGEPELLRAAGRDGTKLFAEIHSWVNYETMLSSCLIGLLVEEGESSGMDDMD
ncbi:hypothetical protein GGR57DRAFT_386012 [Xylariaceae sp. FL1272]|nr:hypothetical protein GGR57DRAFT_386012 [Xylariaceae sp. FL1272]